MITRNKKQKINVVTLGCSKNLVDSEVLMKQLDANGLQVVHNDDSTSADTVIINTCGFIQDAKQESINTILDYVKAKEEKLVKKVFVMGCLSERYKPELRKEIPDVDQYFGANNIKDIIASLGYNYKENLVGERLVTTPSHYAYLKISEGCDRQCSFCAIPLMRGKHRSKTKELVITETKNLVKQGVKELVLIAQDLTYYGVDLYKRQELGNLLKCLSEINGLEWIRLHYAYPASFPKDVITIMRERDNICNYLDIPFQHIADKVLKNMRRGVTPKQTYELINYFRNEIPDLTLRTTVMVGHPGEGEEEFQELLDFIREVSFDRLGAFTYSEEENTYSARNLDDIIPSEVKQQRLEQVMAIQESISTEKNASFVGSIKKVLIDGSEGDYFIGRTEGDSPEVDNEVLVSKDHQLNYGEFYNIKITGSDAFDLFGMVVL